MPIDQPNPTLAMISSIETFPFAKVFHLKIQSKNHITSLYVAISQERFSQHQ